MKKNNKNHSLKAPNYLAMLLATILVIMCVMFVNTEINIYNEIVAKRNGIINSMKTGSLDIEAIQSGYEETLSDMEALKDMSQLGNILVDLDKTSMGQVACWLLTRLVRIGGLGMLIFIMVEFWKLIRIICFNIKRKRGEVNEDDIISEAEDVG